MSKVLSVTHDDNTFIYEIGSTVVIMSTDDEITGEFKLSHPIDNQRDLEEEVMWFIHDLEIKKEQDYEDYPG